MFHKSLEWQVDESDSSIGNHAIIVTVEHIDTKEKRTIGFKRLYDKNGKTICWDTGSCDCDIGIYGVNRLCKHKIAAMQWLEQVM